MYIDLGFLSGDLGSNGLGFRIQSLGFRAPGNRARVARHDRCWGSLTRCSGLLALYLSGVKALAQMVLGIAMGDASPKS